MRTFLYARVSDVCQTIEHQRSHAEAAGFKINEVIADHGVSGVTTKLADRPGGRRLLDKVRAGDQVIVRWVDRLGRNYDDATATIRHLMGEGVIVKTVINAMVFDGSTSDPIQKAVRDAMIAFMAATAQAQAEATKEAQKAGIAYAKQKSEAKYRGRKPSYTARNSTSSERCSTSIRASVPSPRGYGPQSANDLPDRTRSRRSGVRASDLGSMTGLCRLSMRVHNGHKHPETPRKARIDG
jgi:putative DNA-invertase from lambdoid prophage Rac